MKIHYLVILTYILQNVLGELIEPRVIDIKQNNKLRIAFGSCNKLFGYEKSEIFQQIDQDKPDLYIWLGDVAYLDKLQYNGVWEPPHNDEEIKEHFRVSTEDPCIWDDHDSGQNNGDKTLNETRNKIKPHFLEFLNEPKDSIRWSREGVYGSYYIGNNKKVKLILLDVRSFRDKYFGEHSTTLGEIQWKWLEQQLLDPTPEIKIIASGVQILADDRFIPESWFQGDRKRLYEFISKNKVSGVILMSGDVHFAEILKHPCTQRIGYDLFEVCSSGLTHSIALQVTPIGAMASDVIWPNTFNDDYQRFYYLNYGIIDIEINEQDIKKSFLTMQVKNFTGGVVLEQVLKFQDLQYNQAKISNSSCILDGNPLRRQINSILQKTILSYNIKNTLLIALPFILTFLMFYAILRVIRYLKGKIFKKTKTKKE